MTYALLTPPAEEPVSLAEAKAFMRLDGDDEDALLTELIGTARHYLETVTNLSLVSQTWRLYRDDWPSSGLISIAHGPVRSVDRVTSYDGNGNAISVDISRGRLDGDARPARYYLPLMARATAALNGVEIEFTAGHGTAEDVPPTAKQAILRHVAHMFVFRGAVAAGDQPAGVPDGYDRLIAPLKAWRL